LLSGYKEPAVAEMHSFKNLPSERGLVAFANIDTSIKPALVLQRLNRS